MKGNRYCLQTNLDQFHISRNCLIMACSGTKKPYPVKRAIDLYEGQAFRIVRAFMDENQDVDLHVDILSAKYGLIDALEDNEDLWEPYDLIMDPEISERWREILQECIEANFYESKNSFFYGGDLYYRTLPLKIPHSHGLIGKQLHQLKEWLEALQ